MTTHDMQLWAYASKELELGEHRFIQSHLEDCPECVEQLAAIQVAKEALELARDAAPRLTWARTDERIGAMVEKRLARQARGPLFRRLGFVGGLVAAAALAAFFISRPAPEVLDLVPPAESTPEAWARVDRAQGLTLVNGGGEIVDGTELRGGDVLRTSLIGRAFVHLPDQSHVRVGGGSQVTLTRSQADDVALTLERGSVAVRASHQPRKGFVVHTGGLTVFVVGTVFGVANDAEVVEVSVTEGKVRVELPNGESTFVEPGQRLRFDTRAQKSKRLKVSAAAERELAEVAAVADATASVEGRALVPAAGGAPSSPPMVVAQGTPRTLPRLSPAEARARQVTAPEPLSAEELTPLPKVNEQPKTEVVIEAPPDVWPSLGGGEIIRGVPAPRDPPARTAAAPAEGSSADEWAAPAVRSAELAVATERPAASRADEGAAPASARSPADEWASPAVRRPEVAGERPASAEPAADEWALPAVRNAEPAPAQPSASKLNDEPSPRPSKPLATDLEAIFMQRADEALSSGNCDRYLLGLEDIAQDGQRSARSEQARVLRARCFDSQLRPRQAMNEYRKYLDEYPRGRYLDEAHQALGE